MSHRLQRSRGGSDRRGILAIMHVSRLPGRKVVSVGQEGRGQRSACVSQRATRGPGSVENIRPGSAERGHFLERQEGAEVTCFLVFFARRRP